MQKKLLLQEDGKTQKVKEIMVLDDPQKLKMILNKLSWKILEMLSEKEMYPLEIAKALRVHEQKVYYHIRKLEKAGAITVVKQEEKKGATAKYFRTVSPAFGIELPQGYTPIKKLSLGHGRTYSEILPRIHSEGQLFRRENSSGQPNSSRAVQNERARRTLRFSSRLLLRPVCQDA